MRRTGRGAHLGVVHRDVKPGNLMVTASGGDPDGEGTVKILDFGIAGLHGAAAHGRRPARTGDVFGTPLYMSPEQAQGLPVGVAGDLYSFGTILYRMLTGEPPFHAEDVLAVLRMHIHEAPRPPHRLRPDLPMELSDLVLELLAKDPWRRPRDAAQVGARLAALLAGTGTARRATVATPPPAATVPAAPPPGPLGHRALEQGPVDIGERAASGGAAADALAEPVDVPGEDLPETLRARRGQALRWDRAGAPERAVELFGGLLPDVERLYGPRHPETLTVRHHLAVNMSRCGRHAEAARLRAALLPDLTAAYGEGSERVLLTRLHLAFDVGGAGHHRRAAVLLGELVGDLSRALGPDDPNTLAARHHRAAHTGHAGDPAGAARQYHDLLADQVRLYGSEDARTARARDRLAHWWERAH
ncbi:protein kinase domain-containing protein [Marinactinospora thermotolerans]|uniref:non-specific serine/threonine protein kinase n=1 Tax=Marinactinospora thermotolerans DSM 45154 TaxID=1122192 RepID=A0A1T4KF12_9ACTN|nr:Protein kinase domain-containing protein [Marinactinospora thermotolerans DSM 45154]